MPNFWPDELEAAVHDWTGSRAREDAMTVVCRHCEAPIGEPCRGLNGQVLQAFPAHTVRITDAKKVAP
jgi:hypothetical protein